MPRKVRTALAAPHKSGHRLPRGPAASRWRIAAARRGIPPTAGVAIPLRFPPQNLEMSARLTGHLQPLRCRTMEETTLEKRLPVFVLEEAVLLPGAVVRLETDAKGTELAFRLAREDDKRVVVALSTDEGDLGVHAIASLARVEGVAPDGGVIVAVTGRVRVLEMGDEEPVPSARVEE